MKFLIFGILGLAMFLACQKPKMVSEIPEIKYKSLTIENALDTLQNEIKQVKLTFSLIDGDGDIGLPESGYPGFDTLDNKNLFITLYEKKNGEFQQVKLLAPHNYRTPYQAPEGQDKTLKADYEVTMDYSKSYFTYDTIKYSMYIYDRQLHKSNTVETPEIPAQIMGNYK